MPAKTARVFEWKLSSTRLLANPPPRPQLVLNRDHLHDVHVGHPRPRPAKYDAGDWNGGAAQRDMLMRLATSEVGLASQWILPVAVRITTVMPDCQRYVPMPTMLGLGTSSSWHASLAVVLRSARDSLGCPSCRLAAVVCM